MYLRNNTNKISLERYMIIKSKRVLNSALKVEQKLVFDKKIYLKIIR